jgi:isopenicillin N synthase-like dioxygenase
MRKSNVPEFPWPRVEGYAAKISKLWDTLDEIARFCIGSLCEGLDLPRDSMDNLFDPIPQPNDTFSHSIMGMYKYFAHRTTTTTCLVHRDMGLVSLIPTAIQPGLEVLDCSINKWVEVEKHASRNDICIIGCQTLDRVTHGYFPGNIHRVVGCKETRQSIVFKMRAESSAIIDPLKIQCPKLQKYLGASFCGPQCVNDWMHEELDGRESVNFPGKSKDNYHSMVFDPSQNLSIRTVFAGRVLS